MRSIAPASLSEPVAHVLHAVSLESGASSERVG